jgi:GntR family transcriptional regulator
MPPHAGHSRAAPDNLFDRFGQGIDPELPKHIQMRHLILAAVKEGHFPRGGKLPPELELTAMTPFSLGTVQRALRDLVDAGIVQRRQGSGSFIAAVDRQLPYPLHCRFLADDGESYLPIFSTTIDRRDALPPGPWTDHLPAETRVVEVSRRIDVNHEFTVLSRFFAAAADLGSLVACPLADLDGANFKLRIAEEMGLPVTGVRQLSHVALAGEDAAEVIGVTAGTACLHVVAIASAAGRILYVQDFVIPPTQRMLASGMD